MAERRGVALRGEYDGSGPESGRDEPELQIDAFGAAPGVQMVEPPPADVPAAEGTFASAAPSGEAQGRTGNNAPTGNIGLIVFGAAGVVLVAGMGISQIVRGHALPAGWTLLWNGINLVRDAGSPPGKSIPKEELDS